VTSTLSGWLATRTRDELAAILARRPETVHTRHLGEVAARLQAPYAIENVLRELPKPCLELLETLVVFGSDGIDRATLAGLVGVAVDDDTFTASVDVLALWVLAWEAEDGLVHTPGALRTVLPRPLGLGPPVVDLLTLRTVDDLRSRAATLGLTVPSGKAEIVAALCDFYADADAVRGLYDAAPSAQRELLAEAAWRGPVLRYEGAFFYTGRPDPAISWLLTHGLAIADWQQIVVPREVALAVRGTGWHPTLTGQPVVATAPVERVDVERAATAAANATVEHVAAVVEACATAALPVLKTGGVGVRELRRLGKAADVSDQLVRLALALASQAGLVDTGGPELLPTPEFDDWLSADPADRLAVLVRSWAELATVPMLAERPDTGQPRAALAEDPYGTVAAELRVDVLDMGVRLSPGAAVTGTGTLATTAAWRRPVLATLLGDVSYAVAALWAEAEQLGLVALGAMSTLGRALVAERSPGPPAAPPFGPPPAGPVSETLNDAAARYVRDCAAQAIFQADLTVVVTGRPSADLAALLDAVADRESQGAATTWRCSAASVRRALDAGRDAPGLLDELRAVAAGGTLPQPLEYLIGDVARRHGAVKVLAVGCVLRADDPALLAEVAGARSLAALRLLRLAPTVLASAQDVASTLAALRAAGYAPVGETADGVPLLERAAPRRAAARGPLVPQPRHQPESDPYELAAALLAAPVVADEAPPQPTLRLLSTPAKASTSSVVGRYATHLSAAEQQLLATAIDESQPVRIAYTSGEGVPTARVIEPIELEGGMLVAWCHLRDGERNFVLSRIGAVTPAH